MRDYVFSQVFESSKSNI